MFAEIDLEMAIATKHQRVVDLELVGVNDAASAHLLDGKAQDGFCTDIGNHLHKHLAFSFQNTEDGNFSRSASSPSAFSASTEIGLVQFHFSSQPEFETVAMDQNRSSYSLDSLIGCVVSQTELRGNFPGGKFQFKEFDDPELLPRGESTGVDPSSGEVVESVPAVSTPPSSITQSVQFSAPAPGTKSLLVFPAISQKIFSSSRFTFNQLFISTYIHDTNLMLVPDLNQLPYGNVVDITIGIT